MNLKHAIVGLGIVVAMAACGKSDPPSSEVGAKQIALYQQATKNQEQDHQRTIQAFDRADALHVRDEALIRSQEEALKRQTVDFERFEKILDTWERQQAQYQRYLDSLKK